MIDELIVCPKCGSDGCYKVAISETAYTYFDWGCGFRTNDLMKEGEFDFQAFEETMPELYKDVKYVDTDKRVWYPISINIADKGTVFLNGKSAEETFWSAIKVVSLTEEEKKQPKYKGLNYKSDPKSLQHFGNDFIEACDYIGVFN